MFTDNGHDIDSDALAEVLERADILTVGFSLFPDRLLIDTRANQFDGPLVTLVGPVATIQERYQWLGQHRGTFGAPEAFSFFVWPKTVRNLVERDALGQMRQRLAATSAEAADAFDVQIHRLVRLERDEFGQAIRGEGTWKSLWQRPGARAW